jgi:hypothetical protein
VRISRKDPPEAPGRYGWLTTYVGGGGLLIGVIGVFALADAAWLPGLLFTTLGAGLVFYSYRHWG